MTMLILGGQLTVTLGGINEDFVRITCDNVDPGVGEGSIKTLQGLPVTMLILGCQLKDHLGRTLQRVCKDYL